MDRPSPEDAAGFRTAWAEAERRWADTLRTARALPEGLLDERTAS